MKRDTPRKKGRRDAPKAAKVRPDPAALVALRVLPDSAVDLLPPAAAPAPKDVVGSAKEDTVDSPKSAAPESPVEPLMATPAPESALAPGIELGSEPAVESRVEPHVERPIEPAAELEPSPQPVVENEPDVTGEAGPPPSQIGRRGQIQAAKARFDLGPQQRILSEALGELPPGYGLTHCSVWVRDPRHVIAVWDINSTEQTERGQELGWERVVLRLLDSDGNVLRQIPVARRSGIWHVLVPNPGMAVRIAVGFAHGDGRFETAARSHYVQLPPGEPGPQSAEETARLPSQLDRRTLLRAEPPPRPGFGAGGQESPGWRLHQRIRISRQAAQAESWLGPFRTAWDSGVAPPPRVVIEPEPEPSADDDPHAADHWNKGPDKGDARGPAPMAIASSPDRENPSAPVDGGAAATSAGDAQATGKRLDGRQQHPASQPPVIRPYENMPSPASRAPGPADPGRKAGDSPTKNSPSADEPGAQIEKPFKLSTESMSSPRGGFGKPRPERA